MSQRFQEVLKKLRQYSTTIKNYWNKTPTTKIILLNAGVYGMWKLNFIPEDFMVKHFSCERYNISQGRLHTLLTYSFSHTNVFGLMFDILLLGVLGRAIQHNTKSKYIFWLYGLGTIFGGISSIAFQRPSPYIVPKLGPDSAIAAYFAFVTMMNPFQQFYLFFIPMKAWQALFLLGSYSLFFDPEKRYFSGITAGITVHQMVKARFI